MDKFLDALFDPKVIAAALVGYAVRDLIARAQTANASTAHQMASTVMQRQASVASQHATKRLTELVDDRTKRVVDSLLPRARTKAEARVVQLQIPSEAMR